MWERYDGAIWANRFVPDSGWGSAESANLAGISPQLAVDTSENIIVVAFGVLANRFVPGSGWGTATRLSMLGGNAGYPQIAVDPSGTAIAVWQDGAIEGDIWASTFR